MKLNSHNRRRQGFQLRLAGPDYGGQYVGSSKNTKSAKNGREPMTRAGTGSAALGADRIIRKGAR